MHEKLRDVKAEYSLIKNPLPPVVTPYITAAKAVFFGSVRYIDEARIDWIKVAKGKPATYYESARLGGGIE